ncbi:MAG: glycosyltransferase, partial [Candidatus Aenigmarchaeota archaeon]|nr:glycosyltransferase [Candidatus Aenigmarchaeota archaeon]
MEDVLGRFKIVKPYFLYVGNVYPYKNIGRLLSAIKILNEKMGKKAQLVLVGARDIFRKRLEREIV